MASCFGKRIAKGWNMVFSGMENAKDEYEWTIGGYNEAEKYFYANLGLGGMIVDTDEVVAGQNFSRTKPLRQSR